MSESLSVRTRRAINYASLAQDLVLFGSEDVEGVCRAHGLDEFELEELLVNSVPLRKKIGQLRKQLDGDPTAIMRMKASSAVEGQLPTLSGLISSNDVEPKDRINAMRLLSELANALPKTNAGGDKTAGVVLNLNLGTLGTATAASLPRPVNVIEHD